ncbi:MAG TPA: hypothetical protein VE222_00045 [Nitrospiraceae bacterium]|nr:hypothetical protein [Nitrospiraceae bacterium]
MDSSLGAYTLSTRTGGQHAKCTIIQDEPAVGLLRAGQRAARDFEQDWGPLIRNQRVVINLNDWGIRSGYLSLRSALYIQSGSCLSLFCLDAFLQRRQRQTQDLGKLVNEVLRDLTAGPKASGWNQAKVNVKRT